MSRRAEIAEQAAVSLITSDVRLFRDLVQLPGPIRSIAPLALMPFLSAFLVESANYLKQNDPDVDHWLRQHTAMLQASRLRLKILDDNQRAFAEVLANAADLAAINSGWFSSMHRGRLGPVKRLIQPDLGVYFMQEAIICTTHVAFLNLGLTKEELSASALTLESLGPFLRETAIDLGRYTGLLMHELNINDATSGLANDPSPPTIRYHDLKSARLYRSMARKAYPGGRAIGILLTSALSQVNTARVLVPMITVQNKVAAFKIGFVSLYHVASSLQELLGQNHVDAFLHPDAILRLRGALDAPSVRKVRESRSLRNTLVHYGISKRLAPALSPSLPLFGLVEAHVPGTSLVGLRQDVVVGLDIVADQLRQLLPKWLTPKGTL